MVHTSDCEKHTDQELKALIIKNSGFLLCLVDRYEAKLTRYIRRLSNFSQEDIEDILQDVFLKVYQNINGYDEKLKFSSWIYRITHNEVINFYRKNKKRTITVEEFDDSLLKKLVDDSNQDEKLDLEYDKSKLGKALQALDIKYREVLTLYYFEEKTYDEISDILKKPSGTIATQLNRAKKKLFEYYDKQNFCKS